MHGVPDVFLATMTRSKISDQLTFSRHVTFYRDGDKSTKSLDTNYCFTTNSVRSLCDQNRSRFEKIQENHCQEQNSHATQPEKKHNVR